MKHALRRLRSWLISDVGQDMRARLIFAFCATVTFAYAQNPVQFATSDRIVTVERWSRREAKVWAVQKTQIVIYTKSDFSRDRLILTHPVSPSQSKTIQEAIGALPKEAFGFHFFGGHSTHAPLLRLHFTDDGEWVNRRIEASGQLPSWAKPILDAVSAACPNDWRIDFADIVQEYAAGQAGNRHAPPISKVSIRDYYGEKKSWWEFWK